jgi:two-component system phosphate regulon response regulator OmpR
MIRVLFVDDDTAMVGLFAQYCAAHDIAVECAGDATQMASRMAKGEIDVLLLDVGLPGEDGFSVCRRLRVQQPALPIIVVSGRGDEMDRILGLELGADDYVTKPFVPRELVARIKALNRRAMHARAPGPSENVALVRFGQFSVDLRPRELTRNGLNVGLTNAEFDLLSVFCRNPGRTLKRSEILETLSSDDPVSLSERGVDVTVVRLRKLLEDDPKAPSYIKTVWRVGYMFTP